MRIQCCCCLRDATHEYEGKSYCWNCEPKEDEESIDQFLLVNTLLEKVLT